MLSQTEADQLRADNIAAGLEKYSSMNIVDLIDEKERLAENSRLSLEDMSISKAGSSSYDSAQRKYIVSDALMTALDYVLTRKEAEEIRPVWESINETIPESSRSNYIIVAHGPTSSYLFGKDAVEMAEAHLIPPDRVEFFKLSKVDNELIKEIEASGKQRIDIPYSEQERQMDVTKSFHR